MDARRLPAAGTAGRNKALKVEVTTVQVFLHMGDNHVPLGDQDAVSGHQFQIFHEGQVVERGAGHSAAVDLHRGKDCHGRDLPSARRVPLHRVQRGLIQIILKLEGQTVLVVMPGAAAGFAVGRIVVFHNDSVDGDVGFCGFLSEQLDTVLQLLDFQRALVGEIEAGLKSQLFQGAQAFGVERNLVHALQNAESHEGDAALPAGGGIQQPDGAGGQVAAVLVRFSVAVRHLPVQCLKVTGADKCLP